MFHEHWMKFSRELDGLFDTDWEYIVESVISKDPTKRKKNHDLIIGKRCIVPDDPHPPYPIGSMIIESFGDYLSSRWFFTTAVRRFDKLPDGRLIMETENTIYTFKPI